LGRSSFPDDQSPSFGIVRSKIANIAASGWGGGVINWDDGHTSSIHHNDMAKVQSVQKLSGDGMKSISMKFQRSSRFSTNLAGFFHVIDFSCLPQREAARLRGRADLKMKTRSETVMRTLEIGRNNARPVCLVRGQPAHEAVRQLVPKVKMLTAVSNFAHGGLGQSA
jgi:hypothetical protein